MWVSWYLDGTLVSSRLTHSHLGLLPHTLVAPRAPRPHNRSRCAYHHTSLRSSTSCVLVPTQTLAPKPQNHMVLLSRLLLAFTVATYAAPVPTPTGTVATATVATAALAAADASDSSAANAKVGPAIASGHLITAASLVNVAANKASIAQASAAAASMASFADWLRTDSGADALGQAVKKAS